VQFGDDWPGLFLRGDNCHAYAEALQAALDYGGIPDWLMIPLHGLLGDLKSPSSRLLMSLSNEEFDKTAAPSETEITEAFLTGKRARDLAAAASHTTAVNPKLRFK